MALGKVGSRALLALFTLILLGLLALYRPLLFENNLHEVVPEQIYRSAQPDDLELRQLSDAHAIASIVSVRPARPNRDWFQVEKRTAGELGIPMVNISFHPNKMPAPSVIQELIRQLDTAPRPILLHCRQGIDRAGLASSIALLLEGRPLEEARKQLRPRYGHFPWFSGSSLENVLDGYERWLAEQGTANTPELFRSWVADAYIPEFYRAKIEIIDIPVEPRVKSRNSLMVRITNQSRKEIQFLATPDRGVHLGMKLSSLIPDVPHVFNHRAGLVDLSLAPGASTEMRFDFPGPRRPGPYSLSLDLVDESVVWFETMGSQPTVIEIEVLPAQRGSKSKRGSAHGT